jgi:diketogulonate reductase-like aldo/keto reductase
VAEYVAEAEKQGVPKPALYQGEYNPVARRVEDDLFPLLKKNGIKFYAYRYEINIRLISLVKLIIRQPFSRRIPL